MKKILALILAVSVSVSCIGASITAYAENDKATVKTTAAKADSTERKSSNSSSYFDYLLAHSDAQAVTDSRIDLNLGKAKLEGAKFDEFCGEDAVVIEQLGKATFAFNVKKAGFYMINTRYAGIVGKPINMELCVYVDGKVPYTEATTVTFSRTWKDKIETDANGNFPKVDDNGNQLTPDVEEITRYTDYTFHDNDYMTDADLLFYFDKGTHTITLESTREAIALSKLWLGCQTGLPTYEEYISKYADVAVYDGKTIEIASEISYERSDQSLTMVADYSNASTTPADPSKVCLNTIGGEGWKNPGQWISWEIEVPESAKYSLSFKYRQDYVSGFKVYRQVMIDNVIPCEELSCIEFAPNTNWDVCTPTDDENNPYYVYLEKGKHILTLKATLGPVANSLQLLSNSIADLNAIYRSIIGITGSSPDTNRDYDIDRAIPGLMDDFQSVYDELCEVGKEIVSYNEIEGGLSSFIDVMTNQIEEFLDDPLEITDGLSGFKTNISSLADMMTDMKSQAVLLDEIYIVGQQDVPSPTVDFFRSTWFSLQSFFLSFVSDYNSIGTDYNNTDLAYNIDQPIEVWMTSGRDQMNVLKAIIDDEFVARYNIPVNLSLVDTGAALTKAILAGTGPDCALWLTNDIPITYTMRGALENLEQFNAKNQYDQNGNKKYTHTFDEVYDWFYPSAFISLRYLDGNIYALPETQTFKMMFVRDDVISDLDLDVPKTWQDVYDVVTILQRNNMLIGIPSQDWSMFATLLLQHGNNMYVDDYSSVDLSTPDAIEAFRQWTEFNTKYSLPLTYDALNRFRSGEMPLLLGEYTFYNNIEIGAPEIKGLWSMHPIPGTVMEDGSINTAQATIATSCIMIGGCDNKEAVWEFMSWWVSGTTQGTFGQKIEARLGAGGRFATANKEAFDQIPWSVSEQIMLKEAWEHVEDIPKVPGDYYVTRMINNAFRSVVYNGTNAREALLKYSKEMNKEILRKREEYKVDRYFQDDK